MPPRPRLALPFIPALLALALLLTLAPAPRQALAAVRTLSDLGPTDGLARSAVISAGRVVYLADYDVEGRLDLYSAPVAGGAPARLSAGLPLGEIEKFEAGAGRVVFVLRLSNGGQRALYSAPIAGGQAIRLNAEYAGEEPGRADMDFALAGDYAVYGVDQERAGVYQLFTVPVAGGAPVRLSPNLPDLAPGLAWKVDTVQTSDDNSAVAFSMVVNGGTPRLYVTPVNGRATAGLVSSGAPYAGAGTRGFAIAPDGSRVVYLARQGDQGATRIVSVTASGAGLQEIAPAGGSFLIAPDSSLVVFTQPGAAQGTTALASAPIDGGTLTPLADSIGALTFERGYAISPDSAYVYYAPNDGGGLGNGLLRVPVAGGPSEVVLADRRVNFTGPLFSADGSRLLFQAAGGDFIFRVYSYATAGGSPAQAIDDPAVSAGGTFDLKLAGGRAIYLAQASAGAAPQLYSVPLAGGVSTKLNGPYAPGENFLFFLAASDTQAVFCAGTRVVGQPDQRRCARLLRAPADGSAAPAVVDTSRAIVGDVGGFVVSQAAGRAVYLADQEVDGRAELYSVPLAGGAALKLSGTLPADATLGNLTLVPPGNRVIYSQRVADNLKLYSVPVAGGAAGEISGVAQPAYIDAIAVAPGGAQVVFLAREGFAPGPGTLYRASAAGGAATAIDSGVSSFLVAPAGGRVVYAKEGFPGNSLLSAPLAGGAPAPLGAAEKDGAIKISPDGSRVVYSLTGPFGGSAGLVSQPIAGGDATPLSLAGPDESLRAWEITADSAGIVYVAEGQTGGSAEPADSALRRAPIGGGASTPLAGVDGGSISFALAGGRVVYRTAQPQPDFTIRYGLYSVPLGGGQPATLYGPANSSSSLAPFAVSDGGARVAFAIDFVLYSAPAAGGAQAARLSPQGASVTGMFGLVDGQRPFAFTDDGRVVFYAGSSAGGRLYSAPAGGGAATPLSDPLPQGGVSEYALAGDAVVYRGVRDYFVGGPLSYGLYELYAADLPTLAAPAASFSAASLSVAEDGRPQLQVRLAAAADRAVSVGYRVTGGTAKPGVDYTLGAAPLSFAPGETAKGLPLTLADRPGFQGARTLVLALDTPALAGELASATVTITITDDEYGLFLPAVRR